jgi:hypothetical protein
MGEKSKRDIQQRKKKKRREERYKIKNEEKKKSRQSFWGSMYTTVTSLGGYVQRSAIGRNRGSKIHQGRSKKKGKKRI